MIVIEQEQIDEVLTQRRAKWVSDAIRSLLKKQDQFSEESFKEVEKNPTDFFILSDNIGLIIDDHLYRLLKLIGLNERENFYKTDGSIKDGLFDFSDLAETRICKLEKQYGCK